ncbi:unnamed protein product [Peniophora sp. CBMAI 1063]|nr:unnamed protein product [Peniophora sp. CBMAI 1063]
MAEPPVLQTGPCSQFVQTKDSIAKKFAKKLGQCWHCRDGRPQQCAFYIVDEYGAIVEQRSFRVSAAPNYTLLEVILQGHSARAKVKFRSAPPNLTRQIVWELLRGCLLIKKELEKHRDLRKTCKAVIPWTPRLDGHRSTCDICGASLFCCVQMCRLCAREVCGDCIDEDRLSGVQCSIIKIKKKQKHIHDLVLLDNFEVGELEAALLFYKQVPSRVPIPRPLPCREPLRLTVGDEAAPLTYSAIYRSLAAGTPIMVSGINPGERNLTPEYFIHHHGDTMVTLTNTKTDAQRVVPLVEFMDKFGRPSDPENPEKLQDWPPTEFFATEFPEIYGIFEDCLVAPWITSRRGPLNMEMNMPVDACPPDTGPKAYLAHSAGGGTTTRLHCDVTDAVNMLFHEEDGPECGAQWTMIDRDDMAVAGDLLRKWKAGSFKGHPIHSQQITLTDKDVEDLRRAGVHVWTLIQRQGDAVFIPAGVGHQVTNLSSCIKIAVDFITAANIAYSQRIGQELREHRLATPENMGEDILQLSSICWWTFKRCQMEDLVNTRADLASDPWTSNYSAAPAYIPHALRDDGLAGRRLQELEDTTTRSTSDYNMHSPTFDTAAFYNTPDAEEANGIASGEGSTSRQSIVAS